MRFITIRPEQEELAFLVSDDANPYASLDALGIERRRTDTGVVRRGLSIIVYEFGLLEPQQTQFFTIARQLYAGNALLYAYDETGDTIGIHDSVMLRLKEITKFQHSRREVELIIQCGLVDRPIQSITTMSSGGKAVTDVTWKWSEDGGHPS